MSKKALYIFGSFLGIGILVIAYYLISPLFITVQLDESSPIAMEEVSSPSPSAQIFGTPGHSASGEVRIIETEGQRYLRYENFQTINGPDLFVYLSKDLDATDFVNLGRLKATEGNINYEIPAEVNISDYPYALIWCKAFSTLFNYAELPAT